MHISNRLFIRSEMKTSDIIISNPYLILVLEHLGINMEMHEKTISQICSEYKVSTELFLVIVNLFNGFNPSVATEYSSGNILTVINYLKNSHKYYLEEKYPEIQGYIEMINRINDHKEILMIGKFFEEYFEEVVEHLDYEDEVVFPYVLQLNEKLNLKVKSETITNYSVTEYKDHHDDIEEKLTDLYNLLLKYIPQKNDQQIRRKLILSLFELDYDLKIHSRIEETVLIPLVIKMEQLAAGLK